MILVKIQWNFILALIFALIVAIFAVVNVESVAVDFIINTTEIPLILVILGSTLMGGIIASSFGLIRIFKLQRQVKQLSKENEELKKSLKVQEDKSVPSTPKLEQEK